MVDSTNPSPQANGDFAKPLAKSSDPAFTKFTTYIRKTTHRAAKMRLVGEDRELSDLVEDLLSTWLKDNNSDGALEYGSEEGSEGRHGKKGRRGSS